MSIEARNISKHFGAYTALDNVSLKVETGRLTGCRAKSSFS